MALSASYVYTVSERGLLIPEALHSIKSLRRYVDKKDVIVFLTPPTSKSKHKQLSLLATVEEVDNLSNPFVFKRERGLGRYGEKVHLCDVQSSVVVFLDADTTVKKDLVPLLEGDFDFSAREQFPTREEAIKELDEEVWHDIFRKRGKESVPMPSAGFMIFKNFLHSRIKEQWLRYINDENLPNACRYCNPKEQTALALTLSGTKIKWLTVKEHAFRWLNEENIDTYVLHGSSFLFGRLDSVKHILPVRLRRHTRILINKFTK